jgi:hypothetical protein
MIIGSCTEHFPSYCNLLERSYKLNNLRLVRWPIQNAQSTRPLLVISHLEKVCQCEVMRWSHLQEAWIQSMLIRAFFRNRIPELKECLVQISFPSRFRQMTIRRYMLITYLLGEGSWFGHHTSIHEPQIHPPESHDQTRNCSDFKYQSARMSSTFLFSRSLESLNGRHRFTPLNVRGDPAY